MLFEDTQKGNSHFHMDANKWFYRMHYSHFFYDASIDFLVNEALLECSSWLERDAVARASHNILQNHLLHSPKNVTIAIHIISQCRLAQILFDVRWSIRAITRGTHRPCMFCPNQVCKAKYYALKISNFHHVRVCFPTFSSTAYFYAPFSHYHNVNYQL